MTAEMMVALEKLFTAEVRSAFEDVPPIAQLGPVIGKRLVDEGLAEARTFMLRGFPPVTVSGHVLTPLGHATYCMACADAPEDCEDLTEGDE